MQLARGVASSKQVRGPQYAYENVNQDIKIALIKSEGGMAHLGLIVYSNASVNWPYHGQA